MSVNEEILRFPSGRGKSPENINLSVFIYIFFTNIFDFFNNALQWFNAVAVSFIGTQLKRIF